MRLWGLMIWTFCMRAWKTHLHRISCVMHNYKKRSCTNRISCWPKRKFPIGFQTTQPNKNVAHKDFQHLTPSKWQSSQNTGTTYVKMAVSWFPLVAWQFQTPIRFPAVKHGLILEWEAEKSAYLTKLNVRKPLVVSISQRSEERLLYNLV